MKRYLPTVCLFGSDGDRPPPFASDDAVGRRGRRRRHGATLDDVASLRRAGTGAAGRGGTDIAS